MLMFCLTKKILILIKIRTIGISKSNIDFLNKNIINIINLLMETKKNRNFSDNLEKEKLINFEKENDQIFSIVKNYKLYQLLKNDLSKNKYFNSKLIQKKFIFIINMILLLIVIL